MIRAYQHRCIAIGLPYVLNGLLGNSDYLVASIQYCHWRSLLQSSLFKHGLPSSGDSAKGIASLRDLDIAGSALQKMMIRLYSTNADDENSQMAGMPSFLKFYSHFTIYSASVKFHKIGHWALMISLFGSPSNYNAETWESAHRWYVKRWLGKLQHCNESSIKSLMRRTTIANEHGGASNLEVPRPLGKVSRPNYWLRGKAVAGDYKSIFLLQYKIWVNIGHFIIYSVHGSSSAPRVGRLMRIERLGSSDAALSIMKLRQRLSDGTLARWTRAWELLPGDAANTILRTNSHLWDIDIFPMQPDFDVAEGQTGYLSCSHMHIM